MKQWIDRPGFGGRSSEASDQPLAPNAVHAAAKARQDQRWRHGEMRNRVCHLGNLYLCKIYRFNPRPPQGTALRGFSLGRPFVRRLWPRPSWRHSVQQLGTDSLLAFALNLSAWHIAAAPVLWVSLDTSEGRWSSFGTDCLPYVENIPRPDPSQPYENMVECRVLFVSIKMTMFP